MSPSTVSAFGIDIGGSGIKAAPVDVATGRLLAQRLTVPTPQPSTPTALARTVRELVADFDPPAAVPMGLTFPAPLRHGIAPWVANLDDSWVGVDVPQVLGEALGREPVAINDADAAGFAETRFGAARGVAGVVLVITLGTGIGSGMFVDGTLVPNTELGHLEIDGVKAEWRAAASIKDREGLTYSAWAQRLQRYFETLETLFSPDLFVVGGGVSRVADKFLPLLDLATPIVPALFRNTAGIVGAAVFAAESSTSPTT